VACYLRKTLINAEKSSRRAILVGLFVEVAGALHAREVSSRRLWPPRGRVRVGSWTYLSARLRVSPAGKCCAFGIEEGRADAAGFENLKDFVEARPSFSPENQTLGPRLHQIRAWNQIDDELHARAVTNLPDRDDVEAKKGEGFATTTDHEGSPPTESSAVRWLHALLSPRSARRET